MDQVQQTSNQPVFDFGGAAPVAAMPPREALPGLPHEVPEALLQDRAAAHKDLASMFEVSDKFAKGPHLSNQMTPEQFDKIRQLFSDIRMGQGSLSINSDTTSAGNAQQFRTGMMSQLATLMQTDSGRGLLQALHDGKNPVQFHAFHKNGNDLTRRDDDANMPLDNTNAEAAATGVNPHGNGANVMFNPTVSVPEVLPSGAVVPMRPDVVLYHELVHAYHDTRGTEANGCATMVPLDYGEQAYEQQAMGTGGFSKEYAKAHGRPDLYNFTENHYRDERRALGKAQAVGHLGNDSVLPVRASHNATGTPLQLDDNYCGGQEQWDKDHTH